MPIIDTSTLQPSVLHPQNEQIYNGLDCAVTLEVHQELQKLFSPPPIIYNFELALQAPALEMMLRGFLIDEYERQKGVEELRQKLDYLYALLAEFANAVWDKPLNPRSPKQLQQFFYKAMKLPEIWTSKKGVKKLSTDRETLEKLDNHIHARPIIATILAIRDLSKMLEMLLTEVDPDGRMRTSYNVAGTETGRWSSSTNAEGRGTNLQNIKRDDDIGSGELSLRKIFIADPGYRLFGIDLEQAESREVGLLCGLLFNDWGYLDACEGPDLHTLVTQLAWPDLPWTQNSAQNRKIADRVFYRSDPYRYMSKKLGHGSNYMGQPWTMAKHAKIKTQDAETFQLRYFGAFPAIPRWHRYVAQQLQTTQRLTTPWGRERIFFGRPNDDSTLREAIAYSPQSSTGDRLNLGLWRIWKHMGQRVQILAQVHDALYFQIKETSDHESLVKEALSLMNVPIVTPSGRTFTVPGEAKSGWNWGSYDSVKNPDGLKKWKGADDRVRTSAGQRRL